MINRDELRDFVKNAQRQMSSGANESMLRHLFSVRLKSIFPDAPWWIEEHTAGTESKVYFADSQGNSRMGFADTIVGKTAIEYERNLRIPNIFDAGYAQVKEYCAALCNAGIPQEEIYGVLSDTIHWYGYRVSLTEKASKRIYGPEDIVLEQMAYLDLTVDTEEACVKFEKFINDFLGRKASRILNAKSLVLDFGLDSSFYRRNIEKFTQVVSKAMREKKEYGEMIQRVWQNFIGYLGVTPYEDFLNEAYINEFYLVTIAKVICADILNEGVLINMPNEVKEILNGKYFYRRNIQNLVEYDYFGWLNEEPYVEHIVECVMELQKQLLAFDFKITGECDLFGELLAQLAKKERRLLLGQEFTPHWVARSVVEYSINRLPENKEPRVLDMCCGSGVFLIEALKAVREKYDVKKGMYAEEGDEWIFTSVMGFDIDPVAVMLAKVNWVLAMRDLFEKHRGSIIIPIYHADSLFTVTPITHSMPRKEEESYILQFERKQVPIPGFMVKPEYREVYDSFMDKAYRIAMNRAEKTEEPLCDYTVEAVVESIENEGAVKVSDAQKNAMKKSGQRLVLQLEELQRRGKNGIWRFVLSNSYRPGLVKMQFNCIVSNPPWLAMSKLSDNPYKSILQNKVEQFGIKPSGAAHPHMELATTFLLHAVEQYLEEEGIWSCVMPGSLMSGLNHEHIRRGSYRYAKTAVPMQIDALWELPNATFKNRAIVLAGKKSKEENPEVLLGRRYREDAHYINCGYKLVKRGRRSAWTTNGRKEDNVKFVGDKSVGFRQGADIFPRTALFHEFRRQPNGKWSIFEIGRESELYYLISEKKKDICRDIEVWDFDGRYIYECLTSKHLSPFFLSAPVKVIIPGQKIQGEWHAISGDELALMNESTRYVFEKFQDEIQIKLKSWLLDKINIYGKLERQNFTKGKWMVVSNASGANPCAAYFCLDNREKERLVVDQTLYWDVTDTEEEAVFLAGIINSQAMADAIRDFQPQGEFGRRHIHTLPYQILDEYDSKNCVHYNIVKCTGKLMKEWEDMCLTEEWNRLLSPNSGKLSRRRRRQKEGIKKLYSYPEYEEACETYFHEINKFKF